MTTGADGQRQIGDVKCFAIFAGGGDGIHTHAAAAVEAVDADEIYGWRIVAEAIPQRLGHGGSIAVVGNIDRETDHVSR